MKHRFLRGLAGLFAGQGLLVALAAAASGSLPYETPSHGRAPYSHPLPGLTQEEKARFARGDLLFHMAWVPSPSDDQPDFQGLGPLFNQLSCIACHVKNGRGAPPEGMEPLRSMIVRLSRSGQDAHGGPLPHEAYGLQLNPRALPGVLAEGEASLHWETRRVRFNDDTEVELRRPILHWQALNLGPIDAETLVSLRNAQPLVGLGLLEAVPETEILHLAEAQKQAGGPVHGMPNQVWDFASGRLQLGRFGQKANQPSLQQQIASAFAEDLGVTSMLQPRESCTPAETACLDRLSPSPELSDADLDAITTFLREAAVPARRNQDDADVIEGTHLFETIGCGQCHTDTLHLGPAAPLPNLKGAAIHPFTDLLLHDMGEGLADGRPDFAANGRQWRTPPLWGLGVLRQTGQTENYLHDGRARTLSEAILWHGGEAETAREAFRMLPASERQALLTFLNSL
ncbi:di-heme oxidoredictase family protein [Beijerinckia indica]|uniref:Cytochrome c domain-containing protein n=1 Tax=Beijerinckia indica subsp. indica (strain ATCC 9039 / DSM 1715 / NCIMB 8712) TaxID=395963 RepID=B2IKZ6_BEII9|nr:di-heme oxidoredictase family protein [Beijerinckia indica]ACB96536.1 protein of unknown function DUF1111 [Beijerinckia indica subsp. indica ATCC 9039]